MKTAFLVSSIIGLSIPTLNAASPSAADMRNIMGPWEPPAHFRLTVRTDQPTYFIGANVLLHFKIKKMEREPIHCSTGGDYRGASRSSRFRIEVFDSSGLLMEDPEPVQNNMGGLSGGSEVMPGEKKEINIGGIPLNRYRIIEKAGTYRIVVAHDLGWKQPTTKKLPSAETKITFKEPSADDAKRLVESMKKQSDIMDSRRFFGNKPWADWETLRL